MRPGASWCPSAGAEREETARSIGVHQRDALRRRGASELTEGMIEMTTMKDAASAFLSHRRIAVTGVSRTPNGHGSNVVYRRLRERGYDVFAVNPNADEVEGDRASRISSRSPGALKR